MKKLLALVLALVMTLGLATVSANAALKDFSDADSISADYEEAFAVMNAVGVFQGSGTQLTPKDKLTRAQAAKLIAYLSLGEDVAESLPATQVFPDVPATHWAAKYVAWCQQSGIIQGSDGKFLPDDPLTGYAFGAYLLAVLGYDRNLEGVTGPDWQIKAASLMGKNGIGADVAKAGTATLTREEGAQYCFDALQATLVEYASKGTTVNTSDGTSVVIGASSATAVTTAAANDWGDAIDDAATAAALPIVQLGEDLYKGKLTLTSTTNALGQPVNKWVYKGVSVGSFESQNAVLTYTKGMKSASGLATLHNDLKDYANYGATKYFTSTGANAAGGGTTFVQVNGNATADVAAYEGPAGYGAGLVNYTADGRTVEVYAKNNSINHIAIYDTFLGKVASVNDSTKTLTIAVQDTADNASGNFNITTDKGYDTYKRNDYVLLTLDTTDGAAADAGATVGVASIAAPKVVTGVASSKSVASNGYGGTITVDGTAYTANSKIVTGYNVGTFSVNAKYTATLYLDQNDFILRAESSTASGNDKSVAVLSTGSGLFSNQVKDMINGVTSDGLTVNWAVSDLTGVTAGNVYTYAYDSSSKEYTLTASTAANIGAAVEHTWRLGAAVAGNTLKKSDKLIVDANGASAYLTDTTNYIFVTGSGNNWKSSILQGAQTVTATSEIHVAFRDVNGTNYVTAVYVIGAGAYVSASSDDNILFVKGGDAGDYSVTGKDGETTTYTLYNSWKQGEKVSNVYADGTLGTGFYTVKNEDNDGAYIFDNTTQYLANTGDYAVVGPVVLTACANSTLTAGGRGYGIADAKLVNATGSNSETVDSIAALEQHATNSTIGNYAAYIMYNASNGAASYVYIVKAVPSTINATTLVATLADSGYVNLPAGANVAITGDLTLPAGSTLNIPAGQTLTITGTGDLIIEGNVTGGGNISYAGQDIIVKGGDVNLPGGTITSGTFTLSANASAVMGTLTAGTTVVGCALEVDNLYTTNITIKGDDAEGSKLTVKTTIATSADGSGTPTVTFGESGAEAKSVPTLSLPASETVAVVMETAAKVEGDSVTISSLNNHATAGTELTTSADTVISAASGNGVTVATAETALTVTTDQSLGVEDSCRDFTYEELTVKAGATLTVYGNLTVTKKLTVEATGKILVGKDLTLPDGVAVTLAGTDALFVYGKLTAETDAIAESLLVKVDMSKAAPVKANDATSESPALTSAGIAKVHANSFAFEGTKYKEEFENEGGENLGALYYFIFPVLADGSKMMYQSNGRTTLEAAKQVNASTIKSTGIESSNGAYVVYCANLTGTDTALYFAYLYKGDTSETPYVSGLKLTHAQQNAISSGPSLEADE